MKMKRFIAGALAVFLMTGCFSEQTWAAKGIPDETVQVMEQPETTDVLSEEPNSSEDAGGCSSVKRPDDLEDYQGGEIEFSEDELKMAEQNKAMYSDKKALLIQDNLPWDSNANNTVLGNIVSYDTTKASGVANKDLSQYDIVVFANDQAYSTYSSFAIIRDKLEEYVIAGGVLILGACDSGWANGKLVSELPGGVTKSTNFSYRNYIVDSTHPIVTRIYSEGESLTDSDLYNNYCSHVYFNKSSLPDGTNVILKDSSGEATLIEYQMGSGTVIASGLTWEHNYQYGRRNGYGTYAQKAYDDLFLYGLNVSAGNGLIRPESSFSVPGDKCAVVVYDKDGNKPVKGAKVTINGVTVTSNENGAAFFSLNDGDYEIQINADKYNSKTVYEVLKKGRVTTCYVQNSANTSKVYAESLYLTKDQTRSDVLQSRMYFTEGEEAEVSYSINAEVGNNKVTKYLLYQGTNIVTLTSPKGTIKPGSVFEPETPVYLQVVCENNVKSEAVKTNIFIKSKSSGFIGYDKEASEEFKFGDGVGFTVPGDVPIIGGTEFEYSIGSLPVTITTENDKVKIAVGFTDFKSTDETWDDFTKKIDEACKTADRVDELSKLCKAYGSKSGAFTLKKGWEEPELNIAGYIEATWDESKTKLTSVSGQILGGVDFKYSYNQQFVVGPVPVYFEVGAGFGIEISATVKKVLMETGQIQLDVPIAFTPSFTIGGGAGINGALSVGAEGELSAPVTWDITNQYLQVKGKGSMKLTASLLFVFSAKHEIASYEKTFVDYYYGGNKAASETEDTYKGAAEQQIETLDLNDYEEYEVIDTSYQNKTSGWTGNTLESVRKNGVLVNEDIIMRYVLPGTRPQIATAGDTTVMVFQSNNGNSDETECTSLMYSVLEDGMWTSPQFVWEDYDEADYNAKLISNGSNIYLVWQKLAADGTKVASVEKNDITYVSAANNTILTEETDESNLTETSENLEPNESEDKEEPQKTDEMASEETVETEEAVTEKVETETEEIEEIQTEEAETETEETETGEIETEEIETEEVEIEETEIEETETEESKDKHKKSVNLNTTEQIKDLAGRIELAFAVFDTTNNTFTNQQYLTDNSYYDGSAAIAVSADGKISVVWEEIASNDILGAGVSRKIYARTFNGTKWETANQLAATNSYILTLAAGYVNNTLKVACSADQDGDLNTTTDVECYLVESNTLKQLTSDSIANNNVQIVGNNLYWSESNSIVCYQLTGGSKTILGEGQDNYKVVPTDNGVSVIYTYPDEAGTSFYAYDVSDGNVSQTKHITDVIGKVDNYDVYKTSDGIYHIVFGYYDLNDADEFILGYQETVEANDLVLENVSASEQNYANGRQTATISVGNEGVKDASGFSVDVYEDDDWIDTVDVNESIASGEEKEIEITFSKSVSKEVQTYRFVINQDEDRNTKNNEQEIKLGYADVSLKTTEYYHDNIIDVYAQISNLTARNADVELKVYEDSLDGDIVFQRTIKDVTNADSVVVPFELDRSKMNVTPGKDKLYIVKVTTEDEVCTGDNQYLLLLPTLESEITGVQIGDGRANLTYDYDTNKNKSYKLTATTTPAGVKANVNWSSSNNAVATIDASSGNLTIKGTGTAIITAKADDAAKATVTVTVKSVDKTAPKNVKVNSVKVDSVTLSWNALTAVSNYEVYRANSQNGSYSLAGRTSTTSFTDEELICGNTYFYKVRGYVNINGTYIYTNYSDSVKAVPQIAPPTSLSAYSTTEGIRLSWSSSSGANSYEIYRSDKENGTYSKVGTASYTSYTDTKVSYNMTYYYKVVAVNGKNKSSMSKPTSYKYALTAPSYVNVYQQNSDTVRVYVSSVSLADGYELYRSTSQNGKYSKVDTSTSSTLFDLNVTLGKQYYYKARAYKTVNNKTYYSAYSTVSSLTISIAAPYFSSVSAAGDTQIYLLWKEVAGADGYEINAADSYYGTYKKIGTTKDISYLHKVNKKDTYVYYKLRAYKKVGKKTIYSEYSNVSSAMSGFAGPYNIKMAFDGKNNAITFGKCAGAAGTEISVRKGYYGDYEVIANTSGTSYQHKDLMKGSYYYYRFRSYKTAGKTKEYSSYRYMSIYTGVQQVEHLKVSSVQAASLKLSWDSVPWADGYEIYYSDSYNGYYEKLADVTKRTTTNYNVKNLNTEHMYFFKVRAYAKADYYYSGNYSEIVCAKTSFTTPKISSVKITANNTAKLTWAKVSGATGYEIYRSNKKSGSYRKIKTVNKGTTTSYTNNKLSCGKTYYYKIRAYRTDGKVKYYSSYSKVSTIKATPAQVKLTKAESTKKKQVKVTWKKSSGVSGYEVYRSTSKKGKFTKVSTVKNAKKTTFLDKKVSSKKTYYYKVRAYKTVKGKKVYGAYSVVKKVKCK